MKKTAIRVLIGILLLALIVTIGFVAWASFPLGPSNLAVQSLSAPPEGVQVERAANWIVFHPTGADPQTGFIFYPGGRVDYRSYAPALEEIAAQGYLVVLTRMPLSLAIFGSDAANGVMAAFPQVTHWAIGGHSLGGAMAARYAYLHPGVVDGLVLYAAYPAKDNSLASGHLKVISIYGTDDQVASRAKREAYREYLPASTQWVEIKGGNHAQFGSYGLQPGDGAAEIDAQTQWKQVSGATAQFLGEITK
jgi:dienelactone hydrolase